MEKEHRRLVMVDGTAFSPNISEALQRRAAEIARQGRQDTLPLWHREGRRTDSASVRVS